MKVYISVDMEGVSGVVHPEHTGWNGRRHHEARMLLTGELNAAVDGALAAGASEVLVCDSHSNGRNVILEDLHPEATLLWGRQNRTLGQVHGIDEGFDALVMVGFHARASTHGVLNHTINSGVVHSMKLNGLAQGEVDLNAAMAGTFGVPVALVSGDDQVVAQTLERYPNVETVVTHRWVGTYASRAIAPVKSRERIHDGVQRALGRLGDMQPFVVEPPYTLEIGFKDTAMLESVTLIPGVDAVDPTTARYTHDELPTVMRCCLAMLSLAAHERWETTP
ncbi:MAG: M55 family metallopeptidase [Thioalkalivibrio sp.]|nr:M55 family metallopeptidase [Thioalkalivibrio sp.]